MMAKNKLKKFLLVLAASATVTLASCNDIESRMTKSQEEELILTDGTGTSIYNNELKQIYDALISTGDTNSEKVLNNILLILAESKYGSFYTKKVDGKTVKGLYDYVYDSEGKERTDNYDEILTFAKDHSIYKLKTDKLTVENIKDFTKTLVKTIKKSFWSTVKNSTYQERNYFIEALFYKAEKADLYDFSNVKDETIAAITDEVNNRHLVDGHDTYENVDDYFADGWLNTYKDYIERSILQSAYRKALIESYLIANNYNILGRSYARKVQYIAIKDENNGDNLGSVYRLFHSYAKLILEKDDATIKSYKGLSDSAASGLTDGDIKKIRDLRFLDSLYIGYFGDEDSAYESDYYKIVQEIYKSANYTLDNNSDEIGNGKGFYKETKYGKLLLDYRKQATDRWVSSESSTDFTGSNAYTKETGLQIETNSLVTANNVTQGWYDNGGLSDLASDFKTRLFKMGVANELDVSVADDDYVSGRYDKQYTTRIQADGSYYLMPQKYDSTNDTPYVLYDSSSTTWYIIRVDEAVKANKLIENSGYYYDELTGREGKETANQIVWEIAGIKADSDTYKKAANQHYVEEAAIEYHDDYVYDYFEKTFPDLFD